MLKFKHWYCMRITAISDLHGNLPHFAAGDLLLLAGDYTRSDYVSQYEDFFYWLSCKGFKKIVYIGGNHDNFFMRDFLKTHNPNGMSLSDIEYLCDSGCTYEGIKIWGFPWTLKFPGMNPRCMAFTLDSEEEMSDKCKLIPEDTDILLTHGPAYGYLDGTNGIRAGSVALRDRIFKIKPSYHIFGHIHEDGNKRIDVDWINMLNVAYVDRNYVPRCDVTSFEFKKRSEKE